MSNSETNNWAFKSMFISSKVAMEGYAFSWDQIKNN